MNQGYQRLLLIEEHFPWVHTQPKLVDRKYALEQHTYCTTGYELLALAGMVTLFVR